MNIIKNYALGTATIITLVYPYNSYYGGVDMKPMNYYIKQENFKDKNNYKTLINHEIRTYVGFHDSNNDDFTLDAIKPTKSMMFKFGKPKKVKFEIIED